jgi:hypothetical protein
MIRSSDLNASRSRCMRCAVRATDAPLSPTHFAVCERQEACDATHRESLRSATRIPSSGRVVCSAGCFPRGVWRRKPPAQEQARQRCPTARERPNDLHKTAIAKRAPQQRAFIFLRPSLTAVGPLHQRSQKGTPCARHDSNREDLPRCPPALRACIGMVASVASVLRALVALSFCNRAIKETRRPGLMRSAGCSAMTHATRTDPDGATVRRARKLLA